MAKRRIADNLYMDERGKYAYYVARWCAGGKLHERNLGSVEKVSLTEAKRAAKLLSSAPVETDDALPVRQTRGARERSSPARRPVVRSARGSVRP